MKRLPLWPVLCGLAWAPQAFAANSVWEMDPAHSTIGFTAKHMMITKVPGQFQAVTGVLNWDDKDVTKSTVEVTIEAKSISTNNDKRDEHLKSPDFLDVEKFPQVTFKSNKVKKGKDKSHLEVSGDLTIHGVSKPVTLTIEGPSSAVKDPWGSMRIGLSGTSKISRKDFGLTWNKALETGGVVVSDDINIDIAAEFKKQEAAAAPAAAGEPKDKNNAAAPPPATK